MLAGHYYVYIMPALEAMVHYGKEAIGIGREVYAHHGCFFIYYVVNEPGILVGEPVVVLPPYMGGQ
jgi:hypothetical protein